MSIRSLFKCSLAALSGAAMVALTLGPASAFTLSSPTVEKSFASSQVDKVWYCRWNCGGWHAGWGYRAGYGWVPGWRGPGWQGPGWGGVVAPGVVVAVPGPVVVAPAYSGPCWRRWVDAWGRVHWRRVC